MTSKTQIPLDFNPEFAAALGRLLGHWAALEHGIVAVLGMLLGVSQARAQMVFMTFISLKSKLQLIQRLIHTFVAQGPEKDKLLVLITEAASLNDERNSFIHATWGPSIVQGSLTRFPNAMHGKVTKFLRPNDQLSALDVQKVVDRVALLSAALVEFQFDDAAKLVIQQQPLTWLLNQAP